MGRARPEERLDRAMDVFWKRGFYDTSIDELVSRTGLHRAGVYGKFGSKRRLFEASLGWYRESVTATYFAPLEGPDAALTDIETFFRGIHDGAVRQERRVGCLMVNTACEVSPHIRSVARIVSRFLDDLRTLLRRACNNARMRGEVRADVDVDQVGDYLAGSVIGLWALARSPAPVGLLHNYLEGVLSFVDDLRPNSARRGEQRSGKVRPRAR
jgi:TetR/AcrR family transcriptional regulator, transcriptional repressor for nem operon